MTMLDLGCRPGFFTIEMAKLVGETGKVIAAPWRLARRDSFAP